MSDPAARVAAVVLAAGEGKRFGGRKLLAPLDGKPLVQHVIDAANASSLSPVVLVTGFEGDDLLGAIALGRAVSIANGSSSSACTGEKPSLAAAIESTPEPQPASSSDPGRTSASNSRPN